MKPEEKIVEELASEIGKRITRKTIRDLQKMGEEFMSSGDSGLENVWDEICVQVQYERSFDWEAYDETVRQFVVLYVRELEYYEKRALWIQTESAQDLKYEDDEEQDKDSGLSEEDIVQPDLIVVCDANRIKPTHIEGPPTLVIEVLSPSTQAYDRVRKLRLFAASGVQEVWLVTPHPSLVEVLTLDGGLTA